MPGCSRPPVISAYAHEAALGGLVARMARVDFFEGHFATQLSVAGHRHDPQTAAGVRPEDCVACAVVGQPGRGVYRLAGRCQAQARCQAGVG
jgi:hypothetical protein